MSDRRKVIAPVALLVTLALFAVGLVAMGPGIELEDVERELLTVRVLRPIGAPPHRLPKFGMLSSQSPLESLPRYRDRDAARIDRPSLAARPRLAFLHLEVDD